MNFEFIIPFADHEGIADGAEVISQCIQADIGICFADNIDRVIGKGDVFRIKHAEDVGIFFRKGSTLRIGEDLALEGRQHGFQNYNISFSACVHHTGLF